jgi:hypothetical protein
MHLPSHVIGNGQHDPERGWLAVSFSQRPALSLFRRARHGLAGFRDRSIERRGVRPRDPELLSLRAARSPENAPSRPRGLGARDESNGSPQRGRESRDTAT